ncbi:hypothetical protein HZU73_03679 [Apis mellifera caucasica]|uniref:Uncharacterized protein LOC725171 n=1 Tax=Apis mellifera TaxID=7460 RepID=A0A7M7LRI7_APIME|nr:uncharacterized protein LOC725171 [Apis mellifera]KAG6800941.1 hypothetical protein HZU73_03679 [Apis mellifera caucasica]KAG9433766.1 hypothetical protein HZU67_04317 [Apis mellifera carnica]|eukprot:XP_006564274.1 uncharacterized protein LOC725171 [Apis mellifera]
MPEKKLNILEKFIIFSETNTKIIKVFSYGIASISLAIAVYQIKPFVKFRKPSSIPSRFLHKKVQLQGTVTRIEPNYGTLLMVDHKPLIPLPRLSNSKYLPIKIAGLDITVNGISWLQTIVNRKDINFIPLATEKNYVTCIVSMQQNKEHIEIGKELTKLGFAIVTEDSLKKLIKDKDILNYYKCLLNAQKWAQRKRNGHWHFVKNSTLLWRIQQNLSNKLKSILPMFVV